MVDQKEIDKWLEEIDNWDGTYPDPIDNSPYDKEDD